MKLVLITAGVNEAGALVIDVIFYGGNHTHVLDVWSINISVLNRELSLSGSTNLTQLALRISRKLFCRFSYS